MEVITCLNRFLGLPLDTLKLLFSNIDINLTMSLIEAKYAKNGRGRRRFPVRSMLLALILCVLRLYRLYGSFIGGLGTAREICGFSDKHRPYSFQQIHQAGPETIGKLFLNFLFQAFKMGIIASEEAIMVCVDSTFMKAYSRRVGRVV
jgi:hypothetical protein